MQPWAVSLMPERISFPLRSRRRIGISIDGRSAIDAVILTGFCRGLCFRSFFRRVIRLRIFGLFILVGHLTFQAVIFNFVRIIVDFGVLCRILGLGGLRRLEFLVRFLKRLLDQADDELLLAEPAVVGLFVAGQVVLDLLEEFLADLKAIVRVLPMFVAPFS